MTTFRRSVQSLASFLNKALFPVMETYEFCPGHQLRQEITSLSSTYGMGSEKLVNHALFSMVAILDDAVNRNYHSTKVLIELLKREETDPTSSTPI